MSETRFFPMTMRLGYPNRPASEPNGYADKHDAWIAQLLDDNRKLRARVEVLERKMAVLMPDKSDDV